MGYTAVECKDLDELINASDCLCLDMVRIVDKEKWSLLSESVRDQIRGDNKIVLGCWINGYTQRVCDAMYERYIGFCDRIDDKIIDPPLCYYSHMSKVTKRMHILICTRFNPPIHGGDDDKEKEYEHHFH